MAKIPAVIHAEVGQVLHHDGVVLRGQLADHLQLFLLQTDPRRIVGVGIHDGGNVAGGEFLLQLLAKLRGATPSIDVEFAPADAQHAQLRLLDREARIDEEDLVLAWDALRAGDKRPERGRYGARRGHAAPRGDIDIDKGLDERGSGFLELGHAGRGRILRADPAVQRPLLGFHAVAVDGQSGRALVHPDKGDPRLLLQVRRRKEDLPDRGGRKVRYVVHATGLGDQRFAENLHP